MSTFFARARPLPLVAASLVALCLLLSSAAAGGAAPTSDYRNRTLYFIVTDR
ncbi:MAG: hypothetical protein JO023_15460, partial [Chloroflexi bacterium]|nr:hypothetical protein [Chloroflexota bacterium]